MKKKYAKTSIIVAMMIVAAIGYYYYLSNKTPSVDATQQAVEDQEVSDLITKDIDKNYPESPKEVIKLYMRIAKQYYNKNLSDEQVEKLGMQARLLFDDELKSKQTDEAFIAALKQEVEEYKDAKRYISDYKIDTANNVKYKTLKDKKYSSLMTLYYIRENDKLIYSYTKFTLRQDNDGKWKILYWELSDDSVKSNE